MDERQFEMAQAREECGAPIPKGRREALPGVQTCVECQSYREPRRG